MYTRQANLLEIGSEVDSKTIIDFLICVCFQILSYVIDRYGYRYRWRYWALYLLCLFPVHIIVWAMLRVLSSFWNENPIKVPKVYVKVFSIDMNRSKPNYWGCTFTQQHSRIVKSITSFNHRIFNRWNSNLLLHFMNLYCTIPIKDSTIRHCNLFLLQLCPITFDRKWKLFCCNL